MARVRSQHAHNIQASSPLSRRRRPVLVQPHNHTSALRNVMHDGHWEDIPLPVEDNTAQGQPQDLQSIDMPYYDMANHPPVPPADHVAPYELHDRGINNYVGVPQGVPAQAPAVALPAQIEMFDHEAWHAEAGPDQAIREAWLHQGRVPNNPAAEVLRQLANRYLHQPGSQVGMVHMEPGPVGGIRVVITLELADL